MLRRPFKRNELLVLRISVLIVPESTYFETGKLLTSMARLARFSSETPSPGFDVRGACCCAVEAADSSLRDSSGEFAHPSLSCFDGERNENP